MGVTNYNRLGTNIIQLIDIMGLVWRVDLGVSHIDVTEESVNVLYNNKHISLKSGVI